MATISLASLRDAARVMFPGTDRVLASFDAAAARVERMATTTFRYGVDQAIKLAPRPPTTVLSQIQPVNVSAWDIATVKDALEQHELGFFLQSSTLAEAMGRDDRITGCLNTRVHALAGKSGVGFSLTPSTRGDKQAAEDLAKEITEIWWYACSEATMARILSDAVMMGVAFARIHWEKFDGRVIPRLEPWIAQSVYYDWSIRRYRAIGIEGQVVIDPGSAEWLIFEPANFRSWLAGAIRRLGLPFMYRQFSTNDWSRYCEKHGIPILAITEPSGSQWAAVKDKFYSAVRGIGRQGVLRLPKDGAGNGFDVKLIEPRDKSYAAFKEFLEYLNTSIAVTLLGQNLTTEVQGGSMAASKTHNLIRLDYLDADAEVLSTALREYVLKPYVRFNHGGDDEDATPWPTWQTRPPEDKKARADILFSFSQSAVNFTKAGLQVDFPQMAEELEVPMLKGSQPVILMPPGGAPPAVPTTKNPVVPPPAPSPATPGSPTSKSVPADKSGSRSKTADDDGPVGDQRKRHDGVEGHVALHTASETQKNKARHAVGHLVRTEQIPDPNDVECHDCGHKGDDKLHEYDHHKGYAGDNATKVQSVCTTCHKLREQKRLTALTAAPTPPEYDYPVRSFLGGRIHVTIDRPAGFRQTGVGVDGTTWVRVFQVDYGYIAGTLGGDGEALDVYCGTDPEARNAFWVVVLDADGNPDEYKLFLGFENSSLALSCFNDHIPPQFFGGIFTMPAEAVVALLGAEPVARLSILGNSTWLSADGDHLDAPVERTKRKPHPAVADDAHRRWMVNVTMSAAAIRTWALRHKDHDFRLAAASTLHLLKTEVAVWDQYDVKVAKNAAKATRRLLTQPAGVRRDDQLRSLGHNPGAAGAGAVEWHDRE